MITNNLYCFFADPSGFTIHDAHGSARATVTHGVVEYFGAPLRPDERDHLADVAANLSDYLAANFDGKNYGSHPMPLRQP